jgi:hypothetical protein
MTVVDVGSEELSEWRSMTLQELVDNYQIEDIHVGSVALGTQSYLVVSERPVKLASPPNISTELGLREIGYASTSPWTGWTREESNPQLRDKQGIRKWYDMKRNDGSVRGSLLYLKTPVRAAHWYLEPGDDSILAKNIADFVQECLFDDLNVDWSQVLDDVLLQFEYGYMVLEKVYKFRPDGKVGLRKLAPRHPLDIAEWVWDDRGGPSGIRMEPMSPIPFNNMTPPPEIGEEAMGAFIPVRKLAIFSLEPEAGDLRGTSVLRSAYKHWYYKDSLYKIDAIQKERHGIGVPVIKLPPGFSDTDKALAEEMGRNLRTNDRAHIVLPPNWELFFAKLEGQPVDCIKSIEHHNSMIKTNIVAPFMDSDNPSEQALDMFFKSTRYLANSIAAIFNKHIIRQLVDLNFKRGPYPKLRARRIGEWNDLRTFSFALRNFVGAGMITPDDVLEAQLREEADLPPQDFATARVIAAPQVPGEEDPNGPPAAHDPNKPEPAKPPRVGPPRQSLPGPKVQKVNAGRDNSGGS